LAIKPTAFEPEPQPEVFDLLGLKLIAGAACRSRAATAIILLSDRAADLSHSAQQSYARQTDRCCQAATTPIE